MHAHMHVLTYILSAHSLLSLHPHTVQARKVGSCYNTIWWYGQKWPFKVNGLIFCGTQLFDTILNRYNAYKGYNFGSVETNCQLFWLYGTFSAAQE